MDKVDSTLIGLVLAGGRSRRMGQDKALMRYQGKPLFEHAAALLNEAGCKQVLISRNQPGYLTDIIVDAGPLAGVHAALDVLSVGDEFQMRRAIVGAVTEIVGDDDGPDV